ncbi:MAG TPA: ricin-type beta-trefoil lectin domain protein [Actinoplanes sp.]|nr:ricin-type beta-trefoil lectin domain protein [Actinoplanes sp.]
MRVWLAALTSAAVVVPLSVVGTSAEAAVAAPGAVSGFGGKCLDVDHSGTANGTAVQLWTCNGTGAQSWRLAADGTIRALGKCLDVSGSGTANGTLTQLWDCNGTSAQQWLVSAANDLVNPHASRCLDAVGASSNDGTRLQIWDCSGAANQKWTPPARAVTSKRVVVYYQTQYQGSTYFSPAALLDNNTRTTDVVVAAFHLNGDGSVHLNDDPPAASKFTPMWADLARMQSAGVRVTAMVGGAAQGSFQRLDTQFDTYYPLLKNVITTYRLDGVDLDVEESMSLAGVERLIDQLRADFGDGFVITLAPVATAMSGGGNLSGFNYEQLYRDRGGKISWFNIQFYNGWGSIANTSGYDAIVNRGLIPPQKLVAGAVTNPGNGSGYVDVTTLSNVLKSLVAEHQDFGGVDGWEYFNSLPGNTSSPWQWAATMASAQGR